MSIIRKPWPRVAQYWFDEPIEPGIVDVAYFFQRDRPPEGSVYWQYHTLLIDLKKEESAIQADFNKETRYEIKRAESKDNLYPCMPVCPDKKMIHDFYNFYSRFSANKGLGKASIDYLFDAARFGYLYLSFIRNSDEILVWHSYIVNRQRARLLHSASLGQEKDSSYRALIGRANRLLHWTDIKHFRNHGVTVYDFGGWFHGRDEDGQPKINAFKSGFGGDRLTEYDGVLACTIVGRAYLWLKSLRR